jgi:hypothetical protein
MEPSNRFWEAALRRLLSAVVLAGLVLVVARCDWAEPASGDELVVEAFLRTGEPLSPITLRETVALRADSSSQPATGAEVVLTLDGQRVAYEPAADQPGQYVPTSAIEVPERVPYTLTIRWQGRRATASGRTPPAVQVESLEIDVSDRPVEAILVDSLRRDSLDIPAEQGFIYPVEVTVRWPGDVDAVDPDSSYWIRTQLTPDTTLTSTVVDLFLKDGEVFRERALTPANGLRRWTGVYAVPVDSADTPLPAHQLEVALLRSEADYASFATTREDPERREPISNVNGAIGIVAAVALDTQRVTIRP